MDWYQFFKDFAAPIATVIASGAAAFVVYRLGQSQVSVAERNWQTENEKVVLELMERRLNVKNSLALVRTSVSVVSKVAITIRFEISLNGLGDALDIDIQLRRSALSWTAVVYARREARFACGLNRPGIAGGYFV